MKIDAIGAKIMKAVDSYVATTHRDSSMFNAASQMKRAELVKVIIEELTKDKKGDSHG